MRLWRFSDADHGGPRFGAEELLCLEVLCLLDSHDPSPCSITEHAGPKHTCSQGTTADNLRSFCEAE